MTTVSALGREARDLVEDPEVLVDLSDVTRMDSAGLALLVEWQGQARRLNTTLRFHNIPAGIAAIAEVYGLDAVLPAFATPPS
jgi:phospholipid transport system transporter-binding protein